MLPLSGNLAPVGSYTEGESSTYERDCEGPKPLDVNPQ